MKQYHKNPRQITKKQFGDLEQWLRELGDLSGVVHDLNSDEIIGGNQRGRVFDIDRCHVEIVHQFDEPDEQGTVGLGFVIWEDKRYVYRQVRWTERQCEQANIVANKAGGTWDFDILANNFEFADLLEWGFDDKELLGLDFGEEKPEDPGAQVDRAAELLEKWQVEPGQLWAAGEHRLVCGDCTDPATVARVMKGEKADLVFTDAPYNVGIVGGTHDPRSLNFQSGRTIDNDSMGDDEFDSFLIAFMSELPLRDGATFYLCAPAGRTETQFRNALCVSGLELRECIVWVKDTAVFGRQDYHWRHESILYGWKDGAAHYFTDNRTDKNTVWEIPRPKNSDEHPTMKPVELPERAIENSSKSGWIVFDGFVGSGTTLAACERLGRRGRGIEISAAYCSVTLERLSQMGLEPRLVST